MYRSSNGIVPLIKTVSAPALHDPSFGSGQSPQNDVDPRRLWKTIVRRRKVLLAVWLGFALVVALVTLVMPKKYTTQVKLIAGANSGASAAAPGAAGNTNLPILNALLAQSGVQTSETYAELIQQSPVAEEVAKRLNLAMDPNALLAHVLVRPVTDTQILALDVTWKTPQASAAIANAFAAVFVEHERQLVSHQADTAISFLQQDLPKAEQDMRSAQEALATYQTETGIADLPTQTASSITALATLDAKRQTEQIEAAQASAQLAAVQGDLGRTEQTIVGTQTVGQNPVAATLSQQVSTLTLQLDAARKQYTDSYPAVVALKAQLAEAKRQLAGQPQNVTSGTQSIPNPVYQQLTQTASTLQAAIASANAQITTLDRQIQEAKPRLNSLPTQSRRIGDLQRAEKSAEGVYNALQQKYQDALITRTTALSDVAITQNADPQVYRVSPKVGFNIGLGIVVGLVLGLTAVFLLEFFDDRFRTEEDVKERLGLPVLASIPLVASGERADWLKPLSVESFYQLVASLRYSSATPPRTICFTSPDQGDGKSSVATNTAISLGMMSARVLVIDADLRRPSIHTKLGVSNERGLSDVLVGLARFADVVVPTEHARVSVLPSGRTAPNPVALLQSEAFDRLLRQAREQFDFVLIDSPALKSIVDGVVLALKADGTVVVVSAAQTDTRSIRGALDKLRGVDGVNLLGVVLNATRPSRKDTATDYYLGGSTAVALPPEALM